MSKRKLGEGIFLVRFDSQYALASTFLRIQEHYESSRFRNRIFTLEEYMDWYAGEFGAFTYFEDWEGFNVPSSAFDPFHAGRFDPLLEKERRLLHLFEDESRPFYVIGITAETDVEHELAHALFFTRPAYNKAVRAAMRGYDTTAVARKLASFGYHRAVLIDEVQAYLVSPLETEGLSLRRLAPLRKQLRGIFREHSADIARP